MDFLEFLFGWAALNRLGRIANALEAQEHERQWQPKPPESGPPVILNFYDAGAGRPPETTIILDGDEPPLGPAPHTSPLLASQRALLPPPRRTPWPWERFVLLLLAAAVLAAAAPRVSVPQTLAPPGHQPCYPGSPCDTEDQMLRLQQQQMDAWRQSLQRQQYQGTLDPYEEQQYLIQQQQLDNVRGQIEMQHLQEMQDYWYGGR